MMRLMTMRSGGSKGSEADDLGHPLTAYGRIVKSSLWKLSPASR